ncbi:protein of unknown function [Cognatishimia maritima]|uniref:Uncharacterized protein n=1 Tax=Cognatishimia maritima TaxID=870908 RepID=A0A1M5JTF7_9RHOB|nr:protein of unknown function [Cognatishimia maritima]
METALASGPLETGEALDADISQIALAAADLVAGMLGRFGADATQDIRDRAASLGEPPRDLVEAARNWVSAVASRSELMDLWEESDGAEFRRSLSLLIDRLNPDIAYTSPKVKKEQDFFNICAFCNKEIRDGDTFEIQLKNRSVKERLPKAVFFAHLACLNGALHPTYFIQDWKFDPDEIEEAARKLLED